MKRYFSAKLLTTALLLIGALSIAGQFVSNSPVTFEQIATLISPYRQMNADANEAMLPTLKPKSDTTPDYVTYFVLFNHLVGLQEQSHRVAATGRTLDYHKIYEAQAQLDSNQSRRLFEVANDCINAVRQIDGRAKAVILESRAATRNGEVASPNDIPPPPKELQELQEERNQTILQHRNQLKDAFGDEKFAEFDAFTRAKILPNLDLNIKPSEVK